MVDKSDKETIGTGRLGICPMGRRAQYRLLGIQTWGLVFNLPFLGFGLGFWSQGAGLGHTDGLPALGILPLLIRGALEVFGARDCNICPPPPTIKLCWLQTPSSNCKAAYNGCEELGPHRHLCEILCHSARCWWGPTGPLCTLAPWQPFFTSTSPLATAVVSANRKEG